MKKLLVAFAVLCTSLWALPNNGSPGVSESSDDKSILSFFIQPSISFIGFDNREKFQAQVDTIYKHYKAQALTEAESSYVAKQDFQKVNFCFPITAGLQLQWREGHFVSAGFGYIYDNEEVVVTDRKDKIHSYSYTLQGFPLYLEYRVSIPQNLITLSNASLFSVSLRWYWMLPGTEIYSSWGRISANNSLLGNGFGVSLGYLVTTWKNIHIYGDIGYSRIIVESDEPCSGVVPDEDTDKAKWDLGGLMLQFRFSFGVVNRAK
ncbi:MAG: hypothetical protein J6Z31_00560 [Fibrobacter sp.]|nr:hypothetical protein [Fibrobacter sp.]